MTALPRTRTSRTARLPCGATLTRGDLPAPDCRWTPARKRTVVRAIAAGIITESDAQSRYALSIDELSEWRRNAEVDLGGLKATRGRRAP